MLVYFVTFSWEQGVYSVIHCQHCSCVISFVRREHVKGQLSPATHPLCCLQLIVSLAESLNVVYTAYYWKVRHGDMILIWSDNTVLLCLQTSLFFFFFPALSHNKVLFHTSALSLTQLENCQINSASTMTLSISGSIRPYIFCLMVCPEQFFNF